MHKSKIKKTQTVNKP